MYILKENRMKKIKTIDIPILGDENQNIFFKEKPNLPISICDVIVDLDILNNNYNVKYNLTRNEKLWHIRKQLDEIYKKNPNNDKVNGNNLYLESELSEYITHTNKKNVLKIYPIKYKQNEIYYIQYFYNKYAKFKIKNYTIKFLFRSSIYDPLINNTRYTLKMNIDIFEDKKILDFITTKLNSMYNIKSLNYIIHYNDSDKTDKFEIIYYNNNPIIKNQTNEYCNRGLEFLCCINNRSKYHICNSLSHIKKKAYMEYFEQKDFRL